MVKHGLLMGTSEAPRIFSWAFDKAIKRWKMSHQTPPSVMLSAPFTGMEGSKVDGSGVASRTTCSSRTSYQTTQRNQRKTSPRTTHHHWTRRWRRTDTNKTFESWRSCQVSVDMGGKDASHRLSHLRRSWAGPGISDADTPSMGATKRKSSADCRRWRIGRRCEGFGSHVHHGATDV